MSGSERCVGFRFGQFELELGNRTLRRGGTIVNVEPKVLDFLTHLLVHRDRLVTHDELRSHLWPGIVVAQASIGRLAKETRKLVGDTGEQQHTISTRRGYGYQFVAPVEELSGPLRDRSAQAPPDDGRDANTTVVESSDGALALSVHWLWPRDFVVRLNHDRVLVIGRVEGCDLVLGGQSLSRRHARLVPDGPVWLIEDLDSRNGSLINGVRVRRAALTPHDVLRFGDWVGVVETADLAEKPPFRALAPDLLGGPALDRALAPGWQLAGTPHPIGLCGPPGVGKRAAAHAIHGRSGRPGALVELSGRDVAGDADAGARNPSDGTLRAFWTQAARGTLLLRGVTDFMPHTQDALAQMLRTNAEEPTAPRCISTSPVPLTEAVSRGALTSALYEVLHGLEIRVPSLRQRIGDIPQLFRHFLREQAAARPPDLSSRCVERLCLYRWPSNVRELRALAREVLLTHEQAARLDGDCLPAWLTADLETQLHPPRRDSTP